jgi:pyruvate,water dikinase
MTLRWTWAAPEFADSPVGGKARALAALSRAEFPVPEWFVVLPGAEFLPSGETDGLWAVRSSAGDEDGADHSFAGQLESFLNVPAAEWMEKIHAVRASGFSDRIMAYRRQAGLSLPPPEPAVIVQRMVAAEAAGVAFSADPVSGRRGVAVVAAVAGLGEKLVSGEETGEVFHVDRAGRIIHRGASGGPLSDGQILAIAEWARRAERLFGCPQDIEWAVERGTVWILQARPITTLAGRADPDGHWQLWDNSNIAESYSGVTTPLTFSFAREVYEEVYRQFVKILRVPAHRIEAQRDVFARMLGLIRGRVFYNLLSWYRVLAMLPGFAVNRRFMEQMMGVKEPLPDDVVAEIAGPARAAGWRDYLEIAGTVFGLLANHVLLEGKIRAFLARLDDALRLDGVPLENRRPDELAAAYRTLQNQLLTRWDAPLINDFFAMIYFGVSRQLVTSWCGDPDGTLQNDLITCQGGILSAEPARRMRRLAALARENPALRAALESGAGWTAALAGAPEFAAEYAAYLEKFGDRCLEELKLESATLHDDPALFRQAIARLAAVPERAGPDTAAVGRAAGARAAAALAGHPLRRAVFGFVLSRTRARVRDRENLRLERTRVFGRVRRIFLELGRRLQAQRVLEDARDVFFLSTEEVLGFVEGTAVTLNLRELAALRRTEFAAFADDPPADRFVTHGCVSLGHDYRGAVVEAAATGEERHGTGCCPGIVRGRVRVIRDPRQAVLEPGEILVAPRTDPGWILLFPAAAGLLVEHGSLLSHSAIVARELGLPAVVAVPGLTAWLSTGDVVVLDGSTGRVVREEVHAQ